MANKLKDVFNKDEHFIKGTIRFKDVSASEEFRKAIDVVHKEGRTVQINGVEAMSMGIKSGTGTFPIESFETVTDLIIGPSPDEVNLKLEVAGEELEFPVIRYQYQNGGKIQTKESFPFNTTLIFDELTQTAKVNIKPNLAKAENVDGVLRSILIEKEFLKKFFSVDLESGTGLVDALNHLDDLYKLFEKLEYVEKTFEKKFNPSSVNLDDVDSIKDLIELCLLVRDKKVIRANARMNNATGKGFRLASDDEVIVGKEISMTFIWGMEYTIWNEKVELYTANLLNNAVVKSLEELEDGEIRIIYGEKESSPMYITYRGFISENEAKQELDRILENKNEYISAKTVEDYIAEGY